VPPKQVPYVYCPRRCYLPRYYKAEVGLTLKVMELLQQAKTWRGSEEYAKAEASAKEWLSTLEVSTSRQGMCPG
jgi:hypothetical protein